MFKWGKRDSKPANHPKTPKLASVALPDGHFTPIATLRSPPNQKPISNLLFRHFNPDRRNITSVLERHQTPMDTSRARTLSSPSGNLPAPRPIRPHPSQGPFLPMFNNGPAAVPSAQYLEAQIRQMPPELLQPGPPMSMSQKLMDAEYDYLEEKRMKEVAAKNREAPVYRVPPKAYREVIQEDNGPGKASSKHNPVNSNDWRGVPVVLEAPVKVPETVTDDRRPILKSAMKKAPSTGPPLKSAMKKASDLARATVPIPTTEPVRGYYSEGESSRRKTEERSKLRGIKVPSKAWLEVQEEKREEERLRALGLPVRKSRGVPVYGQNAFPPTNSATPSPVDPVYGPPDHRREDHYRTRRMSEPRPVIQSSYTTAYIKPGSLQDPDLNLLKECAEFSSGILHHQIAWPLIEYGLRRRGPYPLIWFDAGFNPRIPKFAVKAKRGPFFTPITREEETMLLTSDHIFSMTIINRKLEKWPVNIHLGYPIRVIDVFRAIYDTYSQPLTKEEMESIGAEAIARCGRAWQQRCQDGPDFTHIEERRGLLRIDLLRGRRILKGLTPIPHLSHTYELWFDDGR